MSVDERWFTNEPLFFMLFRKKFFVTIHSGFRREASCGRQEIVVHQ